MQFIFHNTAPMGYSIEEHINQNHTCKATFIFPPVFLFKSISYTLVKN